MTYLGASLSLAALEALVHTSRFRLLEESYRYFEVDIPDELVLTLDPAELPADWRDAEIPRSTQRIGDDWIASRVSLGLSVPSRVMPQERNCPLNPTHPGHSHIKITGPFLFEFDERLV